MFAFSADISHCRGIKYRREFNDFFVNQSSVVGMKASKFEDGSWRLIGGNSQKGGMVDVNYNDAGNHWNNNSVRPLALFKF